MKRPSSSLGPILAPVRRHRFARVADFVGLAVAMALAIPAGAQQRTGNGFLFQEPGGSLSVRGGFGQARGSSDIFSFITDELTIGREAFASASFNADLAFQIGTRTDLVLGVAYLGSNARSEFRRFVDNNDEPIEQTTGLARVPLTANARFYLTSRGRSIGRFAWVPARFAPFVGVGGGVMWYRLRQKGDFINMETLDIFTDAFQSSGFTPMVDGLAGFDLSLSPRYGLTGEGRYMWAKAALGRDFSGFDRIDLSGYNASIGLYVRF